MRGLISGQTSPGARTCIVVGGLDGVDGLDLRAYRHVLWYVRRPAPMPARFGVAASALTVAPIDRLGEARTGAELDAFIGRDALRLPSLYVTAEVAGAGAAAFLPVVEAIHAQFESNRRARLTRQADGLLWQEQLLANLPTYLTRRVPPTWAGAWDGVPAFVCGAGPSLDASVGALARCAGQGVVLAADTAWRALRKHGVRVDVGVSIDARKTPDLCRPEGGSWPERVVCAGNSPAAWRQEMPAGRVYFLSGRQVTEDWLAEQGVRRTAVTAEENSGITALQLAVLLGCRPIHLFGMDHAVDSKDRTRWHQRDVGAETHQHIGFSGEQNYPKVPGNFQDEIATPLFQEWRMLDARCAELPAGLVVNVTDRGARLRNTTVVLPENFSLPATFPHKIAGLARIADGGAETATEGARITAEVRRIAAAAEPVLAAVGQALQSGARTQAIQLLRSLFRDRSCSHLMGNYSLKIMPHLLQPDENDAALWTSLHAECVRLIRTAQAVG